MRSSIFAAALLCALPAAANPRLLPITYLHATLPKGEGELEQIVDLTPVRAFDTTGAAPFVPRVELTTELEIGLTDKLELGLYLVLGSFPGEVVGASPLQFTGIKQRLRYRLADAGEWPLDVSLYGEVGENRNEVELEARLNFEKRLGALRLGLNLKVERELYYSGLREWVLAPSAGAVYELSPAVGVGLETFLLAELGSSGAGEAARFNRSAQVFAGPTFVAQFKKVWFNAGLYARLTEVGRDAQVGDVYGPVWVRTMFGFSL